MTNGEIQAVMTADKYCSNVSEIDKLKKLGEEVIEFTEAVLTKKPADIKEEAGDICFLILHILSQRMDHNEINLTTLVVQAADKMEMREYNKRKKA